jgi:hypothetical protein
MSARFGAENKRHASPDMGSKCERRWNTIEGRPWSAFRRAEGGRRGSPRSRCRQPNEPAQQSSPAGWYRWTRFSGNEFFFLSTVRDNNCCIIMLLFMSVLIRVGIIWGGKTFIYRLTFNNDVTSNLELCLWITIFGRSVKPTYVYVLVTFCDFGILFLPLLFFYGCFFVNNSHCSLLWLKIVLVHWTNERTDRQTDRQTDGRRSSEWPS